MKYPNNGPTFSKSTTKKREPIEKEYFDGTEDEFEKLTRYGQPDGPKWNPLEETWTAYKRRIRGLRGGLFVKDNNK